MGRGDDDERRPATGRAVRVMALPAFFNRRVNPYNFLLYDAVRRRGATVHEVTPLRVWRARHDVVHIHWPEYLFSGRWRLTALAKAGLTILSISRLRARGVRVTWTIHNLGAHEPRHPGLEARMWDWFVDRVDGYIALSASGRAAAIARFPALAGRPGFVVPHGHYRDEYPQHVDRAGARARLGVDPGARVVAFVGAIRPYKDVPALIRAVRELDGPEWCLLVAGSPASPALAEALRAAAGDDSRIRLDLRFIPRDDVQLYLRAADLVVLPYTDVLNSGSALLALSFERPVLVADRGAMSDLQATVGDGWVRTFSGRLGPGTLVEAMGWATATGRDPARLLRDLDWDDIAAETLRAYEAIRLAPVSARATPPATATRRPVGAGGTGRR